MLRPLRHLLVVLATLAAAACSTSGGTEWIVTTGAGGATSTLPSTSSTGVAGTSSTSTLPPEPASSTTPPSVPAYCPQGAGACEANSAAAAAYLQAHVTGGSYGFRFVRLGGEVVASLHPEEPFYPASSVKVLLHLHAVRWVAAQPDRAAALATPIPVCDESCTGQGTCWTEPLSAVLSAMMVQSDNRRANAVLEYFSLAAIGETATAVVGTSGTRLVHRFGCGGPANDPANQSTALDLSRVFERVARDEVLDADAFATFAGLMLGPLWPSLASAVADEGVAAGLEPEEIEAFRSAVELSYKAGWWDNDLSLGGLLTLPAGPCEGDLPRQYAFAVFVSEADGVAAGFDVSDVAAVALRAEIRAALADWADPECTP